MIKFLFKGLSVHEGGAAEIGIWKTEICHFMF